MPSAWPMIRFERGRDCLWMLPAKAAGGGERPPAILFLHGVGERGRGGSELPWAARWGLPKLRAEGRTLTDEPFPFLVAAPQCPPDRTWLDPDVLAGLDCLLHDATATGAADPARLCVANSAWAGSARSAWRFAGSAASPR